MTCLDPRLKQIIDVGVSKSGVVACMKQEVRMSDMHLVLSKHMSSLVFHEHLRRSQTHRIGDVQIKDVLHRSPETLQCSVFQAAPPDVQSTSQTFAQITGSMLRFLPMCKWLVVWVHSCRGFDPKTIHIPARARRISMDSDDFDPGPVMARRSSDGVLQAARTLLEFKQQGFKEQKHTANRSPIINWTKQCFSGDWICYWKHGSSSVEVD